MIKVYPAMFHQEEEGGFVTYVSTVVEKYLQDTKAVKKMLSIPSWLAKEAEAAISASPRYYRKLSSPGLISCNTNNLKKKALFLIN